MISSTCMQYRYIQGHVTLYHPDMKSSTFACKRLQSSELSRANKFEPVLPAVLLLENRVASVKFSGGAASAFGRVGTIEVRDVIVANIAKPD